MRNIVVTTFVSLDGVMEDPHWTMPYWNDQIAMVKFDELFASDAMLLGRVTYEGFAQAWPGRTDEQGYADRMNTMPKYVVSTTLKRAEWSNSHIISGNVVDEIARLKQSEGGDILVHGSATLVNTLLENNLADMFRLLIYPLVLGQGRRLFKDGSRATLKLVGTRQLGNVTELVYRTAASEA
jgi:dihydrofolate reductase